MTELLAEGFVDTFQDGVLAEGVQRKNGVLYTLPESGSLSNSMIFYNKDILAEASAALGYFDPTVAGSKALTGCELHPGAARYYEEMG